MPPSHLTQLRSKKPSAPHEWARQINAVTFFLVKWTTENCSSDEAGQTENLTRRN